jgi:hypothetical protein
MQDGLTSLPASTVMPWKIAVAGNVDGAPMSE